MKEHLVISLIMLGLVVIDGIGDALRLRGWQIPHHIAEILHVSGWIAVWALFGFEMVYIPIYIVGRVILFDIVFNLVAGLPIGHIGKSSLYDIVLTWFGKWVKNSPVHFVFIFRFMALLAWIGLILTKT